MKPPPHTKYILVNSPVIFRRHTPDVTKGSTLYNDRLIVLGSILILDFNIEK